MNTFKMTVVAVSLLSSGCASFYLPYNDELKERMKEPYTVEEEAKADEIFAEAGPMINDCAEEARRIGRPLTDYETRMAVAMGVVHPEDVRMVSYKLYDWTWALGGVLAHTCNNTIWTMPYGRTPHMLAHEMVHVAQWETWPKGGDDFNRQVYKEMERTGYMSNRFEYEADRKAYEWSLL